MTLSLGNPAPNFSLPNQNDKPVSLGDFAGKWVVIYFYPKDDTPGCTIEACQFTEAIQDLQILDAVVLGVSADNTQSHRDFIAKFKLKIDLLSDEKMDMIKAYGVWGEKVRDGKTSMGIIRQTVLIDPQGNVAAHWPAVTPDGHALEVQAKLKELQG
jgi:peroxiredoxin Q/BCP